jgi:membrane-associated phospholipid phosphatase
MTARLTVPLTLLLVLATSRSAAAQQRPDELTLSYLWDGGAVPFVYGSLLGTYAVHRWAEPPAQPRLFSRAEGGAPSRIGAELPGPVITAGTAAIGLGIALGAEPARWYHLKGLVQSAATTALVTAIGKVSFGRQRPDFTSDLAGVESRKSFPSGHSSAGLATITYTALYLRHHAFARYRTGSELPWWEVTTYAGLAALAVAIPAERVHHNRHHVTDVLVGSALGATTSALFFSWQERRYRRARSGEVEPNLQLAPAVEHPGLVISGRF